jgi:hypothetical protein
MAAETLPPMAIRTTEGLPEALAEETIQLIPEILDFIHREVCADFQKRRVHV